jgi:hypothetical protein
MIERNINAHWGSKTKIPIELNCQMKPHRDDEHEQAFDGQLSTDEKRGKEGHARTRDI